METKIKRTALITGASDGIGYELAKQFAKDGINLVLVARREKRLNEITTSFKRQYGIHVDYISLDLSVPGQATYLYELCRAQNLQIDYLVNNAGYGDYGEVANGRATVYDNMLTLNILTLTTLTSLFVKDMIHRGFGKVLNVGSMAAFQPVPKLAAYAASKTYVMHFTEALHDELKGTGVTATVLNPGVTETGFVKRANMSEAGLAKGKLPTAAEVAQTGYQGMMNGELNIIPGLLNKITAFGIGLTPSRNILLAISSFIMR